MARTSDRDVRSTGMSDEPANKAIVSPVLLLMILVAGCSSTKLSSPGSGACRVQTVGPGDIVLAWSTENTHTPGIQLDSVHYDGRTEAGKLKFSHLESSVANEVVSPLASSDTETILLEPKTGETVAASRLGGSY